MNSPLEEVSLRDQGALMVLSEHPDLTELCRNKRIIGNLVWVVYKYMAKEDPQEMKKLLFLTEIDFKKILKKNKTANAAFSLANHPYIEKGDQTDEKQNDED